eukprot:scaffold128619_cov28-Tisochrysis_lutea.AAC.6
MAWRWGCGVGGKVERMRARRRRREQLDCPRWATPLGHAAHLCDGTQDIDLVLGRNLRAELDSLLVALDG